MKRYISVLALDARCIVYKLAALLVVSTIVQIWDFRRVLMKNIKYALEVYGTEDFARTEKVRLLITFERAMEESFVKWIFCITMLVVFIILSLACSERKKVRTKQFWWRLRIERRQLFAVWALHRIFWFGVLIAWQIGLTIGMNAMYQELVAKGKTTQTLFMAFHRDGFLHNILPLTDVLGMVKLCLMVVFMGMAAAYVGYMGFEEHRSSCSGGAALVIYAVVLFSAGVDTVSFEWVFIIAYVIAIVYTFLSVKGSLGVHYDV